MKVILIKIRNKFNKAFAPIVMFFFRIFKIENNKIVVFCHNGKGYGDSAKYIVEELLKDNKYDIVWAINKGEKVPDDIRTVPIFSLKCLYELSTAKIWINNLRFRPYIRKRKNQFYLQTWHSCLRIKKIELDAPEFLNKYYLKQMKNDSKMIDLMTSGCEFSTQTYKRAFFYNGNVELTGTPRCDLFFHKKIYLKCRSEICKKYGLDSSKRLVLYAPTFRENSDCNKVYMNLKKVVKAIPNDTQFLVRLHPNKKCDYNIDTNFAVNVTSYPDIQELLAAVDVLITDYSGCCMDMMIASKPVILLLKDMKDYLSKERAVYFKMDELPFTKAFTDDELIDIINNKKYKNNDNKIEKFKDYVGLFEDGNASKRIKKILVNVMEEQNEKI